MARFIATARGYANDQIYNAGDEFEFTGAPGQWCHEVGKEPIPRVVIDHKLQVESDRYNDIVKKYQASQAERGQLHKALNSAQGVIKKLQEEMKAMQIDIAELKET